MSTPTAEFSLPTNTHHCFLHRTTQLLRTLWLGRDFRGEIDTYVVFLRENRDVHHKAGKEDFYAACRVLGSYAETFQTFATVVDDLNRSPEGDNSVEGSPWIPLHRKLERVAKLLVAEQGLVLKAI